MASKSIKDLTKDTNWTLEGSPSIEYLKLSAMLRIAEASEKMASNYLLLERDRDFYKRQYDLQRDQIKQLRYAQAGYKAALTRLRNKLASGDSVVNA